MKKSMRNISIQIDTDLADWIIDHAWEQRTRVSPLIRKWIAEKKAEEDAKKNERENDR